MFVDFSSHVWNIRFYVVGLMMGVYKGKIRMSRYLFFLDKSPTRGQADAPRIGEKGERESGLISNVQKVRHDVFKNRFESRSNGLKDLLSSLFVIPVPAR